MEQVKIDSEKNCEKNCSGRWLSCASEALHRSNIHPYVFAAAIKNLLENGWSKHRNIFLMGPADIFLLGSLAKDFPQTLSNHLPQILPRMELTNLKLFYLETRADSMARLSPSFWRAGCSFTCPYESLQSGCLWKFWCASICC